MPFRAQFAARSHTRLQKSPLLPPLDGADA
jgi:hypothetical protein